MLILWLKWGKDGGFCFPSPIKSCANGMRRYGGYLGPLGQWLCYAVDSQPDGCALVAGLLYLGKPVTIVGGVCAIIITSLNRMLRRRPCPHVFIESLEGREPSVTDTNAASPIVFVIRVIRIGTTLFHHTVNLPFRRLRFTVCDMVRMIFALLGTSAAAARTIAALKVVRTNNARVATFAQAMPKGSPFTSLGKAYDGQFVKFLTRQVLKIVPLSSFSHSSIMAYKVSLDKVNYS
jgi:hypothetical protein